MSVRHGDLEKMGYVASGFWSGFTIGRVVLADITHKFGERRMVFIYTVLALIMQLAFWLIPSIPANAVTVCLLGVLLKTRHQFIWLTLHRFLHWSFLSGRTICSHGGHSAGTSHRSNRFVKPE